MDMLEVYLDAIRRNDTDTENKRLRTIQSRVKECLAYFSGRDIQALSDADLEAWRLHLTATKPGNKKGTLMSDKTSNDYVTVVKDYIDWLAGQAGQLTIPLTEQKGEADNMNVDNVENSEILDVEETPRKAGRKPKQPAEKRSVKLSIYITPGLARDVKTLAACSMQDISDITFALLEEFVERNRDKLEDARTFFANFGTVK